MGVKTYIASLRPQDCKARTLNRVACLREFIETSTGTDKEKAELYQKLVRDNNLPLEQRTLLLTSLPRGITAELVALPTEAGSAPSV